MSKIANNIKQLVEEMPYLLNKINDLKESNDYLTTSAENLYEDFKTYIKTAKKLKADLSEATIILEQKIKGMIDE